MNVSNGDPPFNYKLLRSRVIVIVRVASLSLHFTYCIFYRIWNSIDFLRPSIKKPSLLKLSSVSINSSPVQWFNQNLKTGDKFN